MRKLVRAFMIGTTMIKALTACAAVQPRPVDENYPASTTSHQKEPTRIGGGWAISSCARSVDRA